MEGDTGCTSQGFLNRPGWSGLPYAEMGRKGVNESPCRGVGGGWSISCRDSSAHLTLWGIHITWRPSLGRRAQRGDREEFECRSSEQWEVH